MSGSTFSSCFSLSLPLPLFLPPLMHSLSLLKYIHNFFLRTLILSHHSPTLMTSFNLNYFLTTNIATLGVGVGDRLNEFEGTPSIHNDYSSFKRKDILAQATIWTNLEDIMLSEISQSQR